MTERHADDHQHLAIAQRLGHAGQGHEIGGHGDVAHGADPHDRVHKPDGAAHQAGDGARGADHRQQRTPVHQREREDARQTRDDGEDDVRARPDAARRWSPKTSSQAEFSPRWVASACTSMCVNGE